MILLKILENASKMASGFKELARIMGSKMNYSLTILMGLLIKTSDRDRTVIVLILHPPLIIGNKTIIWTARD